MSGNAKSRAAEKEMASRILSKRRLLAFIQRMNPKYMPGWVHEDICRRLEQFSDDVEAGLSPRLMLLMPPRAGKSEIASKTFPAWHLGRHPDHEIISCSYNVGLAMDFSKKIKALLEDPAFQSVFEIRLDPENKSSESWGLSNGGGSYVAAGIGGGINGKGATILIIDDPLKNAEEADSATHRESVWNWFASTAYTRLAPGAGVLIVQCMTGDTPVLLPDGTQKRLDAIRAGDTVATYEDGRLSSSTVAAWKSNGHDLIYKITMTSGRIVRANGRHPFLVSDDGELKWIRTRSLNTVHKIVALPGSGGSGEEKLASERGAPFLPYAEATAPRTTTKKSGPISIAHLPSTPNHAGRHTSSTATASLQPNMLPSLMHKEESALSVATSKLSARLLTGEADSVSITATTPAKSGDCSAMIATPPQDTLELSALHSPWLHTSDFTTDSVLSVEPDGEEEVFDVQIDRTENFIANGLVSHNTWWHDDDLAGRLQTMMANDPEADQYVIVKYPAIAEHDEYLNTDTDLIERLDAGTVPTDNLKFLRAKGEALHPARFDLPKLNRIKNTLPQRFWSALYQQNPVPDDGAYFTKDQFRRGALPDKRTSNVCIAWDFAISEKAHNDYTVGSVGLQDQDDVLHVAEMVRFKSADAFFIVESILKLAQRWYHPSLTLGFEDGQIYRSIDALLKKRMREMKFYPSIVVLKPITDKMARGRVLQGRMQQGMVSFNDNAEWYDTARNEMLRFPAGVHDDCCLVAGTKITMADGTVKDIERVRSGDMVKTPQGACRVTAAAMTNSAAEVIEISLPNGRSLTGTYDHPVWSPGHQRFVALGSIEIGSKLEYHEAVSISRSRSSCLEFIKKPYQVRSWNWMEKSIVGICSRTEHICGTISRALAVFITRIFGLNTTGQSPRATIFTTGTAAPSITRSIIWSACLHPGMPRSILSVGTANNNSTTLNVSGRLQKLGILPLKALHGIQKTEKRLGLSVSQKSSNAPNVAANLNHLLAMQNSAAGHAAQKTGRCDILNTTHRKKLGKKPVYNLTVDNEHVYYANGILTHNCDSLAWMAQMAVGKEPQRKPQSKSLKSWKDKLRLASHDHSYMAA